MILLTNSQELKQEIIKTINDCDTFTGQVKLMILLFRSNLLNMNDFSRKQIFSLKCFFENWNFKQIIEWSDLNIDNSMEQITAEEVELLQRMIDDYYS